MTFILLIRILLMAALAGTGLMNLFWMLQRRGSPAEFRGFLFAGSATLLFAGALLALVLRQNVSALAAAIGGGVCGLVWFRHVYVQSLHNTTM